MKVKRDFQGRVVLEAEGEVGPQRLANGDVLIACKAGRAREKRLCFLLG